MNDLKRIPTLLDELFDFEKNIPGPQLGRKTGLAGSGDYKFLRSHLISRWNTLDKLGTYPSMITPLLYARQ